MSAPLPLYGHADVRRSLARASRQDDLPGSLLIHGPPGVGKQSLGLWLARLLNCEAPGDQGPCDACTPCRLANGLQHPDIHWFFPLPRPRVSGGPEKLADALEEARAAELATRRADPYRPTAPGEPVGLYLAQVQTIRRLAAARPAMGRRKVFLIGDAELLVPQESSPEAANALLKVLEEPPPATTFILTASDPEGLLPTIRSRLLPIRLRPLPEGEVARFLVEQRGVPEPAARLTARLAQGSIGRALGFLPAGDEPGPLEAIRQQARALLDAAAQPSPLPRLAAAHALPATGARGAFTDLLDALTLWIRDLAATSAGAQTLVVNADALDFLQRLVRLLPNPAANAPAAIRAIDEARALARTNTNPQLTLAWLLNSLHRILSRPHPQD